MAQTSVSIRIDEDTKREAELLFSKLGLTLSAATNVFYRQAVRTQGIPFPLTMVENPATRETILSRGLQAMKDAQEQAVINGTSEMTLDEINAIIKECRESQ
ncbi:MAG: type II toxin-antitoxin system RelB/DinJ family antitoxin [Oscillospiraceae bacterium]|nr:type II toxin-antitoxin system RelB/DinJ family antitoxin [Oscillospiraceae bacterium]